MPCLGGRHPRWARDESLVGTNRAQLIARCDYPEAVSRTDRILMGPGPCNPYPEVTEAMVRPMLGHLDPEFISLLDETCERLRLVFKTKNPLTLPISGTGSAGMEAAFVNLVKPGDPVVVGVNGVFGERMCEVATRSGAQVIRVEVPWGTPIDPALLLDAHPNPSIISVVHAETSTGVRNDIAPLGQAKGDALLLVDCVTSMGGIELEVDAWGIDIAYGGTQKCLGVPPGLAPLTFSERARSRIVEKPSSWYLDLNLIGRYTGSASGARTYHHTAPITMIQALHAGTGAVIEEGLDQAWKRHGECGSLLQAGLEKLGLTLFAQQGHRLPQLTSVLVPEDINEAALRAQLLDRYGIEIGGGLGDFAGRMWRVGCMGHTARVRNVRLLLCALEELI